MKSEKTTKGKNVSVSINDKTMIAKIDQLSAKIGITPRQFIKNSIEVGVEEMTILNNIGYIKAAFLLKSFKDQFVSVVENEKADSKSRNEADIQMNEIPNHFTIWLNNDVINKLDYFQEKMSLKSRSELINKLIKMNFRDLFYFEVSGLLQMSTFLRDKWRKRFKETQEAIDEGELKIDLK